MDGEEKTSIVKRCNAANSGKAVFWNAYFMAVPKWHQHC
jgi:hypothetical protein